MPDIILFDGVCNFCNATINFIMEHDPERRFRFASLQSVIGQKILSENRRSATDFDTVLLLRDGLMYEKSDAALEIARYLRGWSWLYAFRVLPRFLRNAVYDLVAKNRYRLFGKSESCRLPSAEERALFLV
jgi:predicted DCC family thiol-disulfide oxidoreductase YuxK